MRLAARQQGRAGMRRHQDVGRIGPAARKAGATRPQGCSRSRLRPLCLSAGRRTAGGRADALPGHRPHRTGRRNVKPRTTRARYRAILPALDRPTGEGGLPRFGSAYRKDGEVRVATPKPPAVDGLSPHRMRVDQAYCVAWNGVTSHPNLSSS
jgi:hypothetical protein